MKSTATQRMRLVSVKGFLVASCVCLMSPPVFAVEETPLTSLLGTPIDREQLINVIEARDGGTNASFEYLIKVPDLSDEIVAFLDPLCDLPKARSKLYMHTDDLELEFRACADSVYTAAHQRFRTPRKTPPAKRAVMATAARCGYVTDELFPGFVLSATLMSNAGTYFAEDSRFACDMYVHYADEDRLRMFTERTSSEIVFYYRVFASWRLVSEYVGYRSRALAARQKHICDLLESTKTLVIYHTRDGVPPLDCENVINGKLE